MGEQKRKAAYAQQLKRDIHTHNHIIEQRRKGPTFEEVMNKPPACDSVGALSTATQVALERGLYSGTQHAEDHKAAKRSDAAKRAAATRKANKAKSNA